MCIHLIVSLVLAASAVVEPPAPPRTPAANVGRSIERLDDIAEQARAAADLPGVAVAIVDRDGLRGLGVAGVRQRGEEAKIDSSDRFHLGSCTKAFTATLVALLVREGKLRWDSTIGDVFAADDRLDTDELDEGWKAITIEELLRHRGGAPTAADPKLWSAAWACRDAPEACRATFVRGLLTTPPAVARGTYAYSNQGYAIAGRMCELATGETWEALVQQRIAQPLGMRAVGFGPPSRATEGQAPVGHLDDGAMRDIDNPAVIAPAGTLHCTMEDWARFVALHLGGAHGLPLGQDDLARLHSAPEEATPRSALGWFVHQRAWGGRVLNHSGSNSMWFCTAWVAPERGFAVLIATNQGGAKATQACDAAAGALIQRIGSQPTSR